MGQLASRHRRRPKKEEEDKFSIDIPHTFATQVLFTELDADVDPDQVWQDLAVVPSEHLQYALLTDDPFRKHRRKAVVTYIDQSSAKLAAATIHRNYFYHKQVQAQYLREHLYYVTDLEMSQISQAQQEGNSKTWPRVPSEHSMGINVIFSTIVDKVESLIEEEFSICGKILWKRAYKKGREMKPAVYIKYAYFSQAYAAYLQFDGSELGGARIRVIIDKNPYYYIMYLEGKRFSSSVNSTMTGRP